MNKTNLPLINQDPEVFSKLRHDFDPSLILEKAQRFIDNNQGKSYLKDPDNLLSNAMAIDELKNGLLMANAVRENYRPFCIAFKRQLETEFECNTPSKQAMAEVASLNFSRVIDTQKRITEYLQKDDFTGLGIKYLLMLSKELDRAQRHFASSIQQLQSTKFPPIRVSIKATSAVFGQNQLVQVNQ